MNVEVGQEISFATFCFTGNNSGDFHCKNLFSCRNVGMRRLSTEELIMESNKFLFDYVCE